MAKVVYSVESRVLAMQLEKKRLVHLWRNLGTVVGQLGSAMKVNPRYYLSGIIYNTFETFSLEKRIPEHKQLPGHHLII